MCDKGARPALGGTAGAAPASLVTRSPMRSRPLLVFPALALLTGCPDPDADFADFQTRFAETCKQFPEDPRCKKVEVDCASVRPANCMLPAAGAMDGHYFLSL